MTQTEVFQKEMDGSYNLEGKTAFKFFILILFLIINSSLVRINMLGAPLAILSDTKLYLLTAKYLNLVKAYISFISICMRARSIFCLWTKQVQHWIWGYNQWPQVWIVLKAMWLWITNAHGTKQAWEVRYRGSTQLETQLISWVYMSIYTFFTILSLNMFQSFTSNMCPQAGDTKLGNERTFFKASF